VGHAGSADAWLRRVRTVGNALLARTIALELRRSLDLPEAFELLALLALSRAQEPERYDRAAARLGRPGRA
jgi:hypothetical protein